MAPGAADTSSPTSHLADFTTDRRVLVLSLMSVLVGAVCALIAWALVWLIGVITNLAYYHRMSSSFISPAANALGAWALLVPVAGGLIIGLMARYGSEKIRGHGIPEALESILVGRSRMEAKVAVLKPLSSAISIGTGGPFGAEGPIIMTGGAFGSLFGQVFRFTSTERRTLLVAGAAGGMSAIFAAPVAAVMLAVELLFFEWRPRSFIPVALASLTAGTLRIPLLGPGPIFPMSGHAPPGGTETAWALVMGLLAGLLSVFLTKLVYAFEDLFRRLPIHWMWWPALGGLAVGLGGLLDPRVLGVGYDTIRAVLQGRILAGALLVLLAVKALVWALSLGSGTSGGVLAPLLMMGAALGAAAAPWIPSGSPSLWALAGMAAVMGGTMRAPFTAVMFALELTHDVRALPVLLASCVASELVTVLALRRSILTEKVARRGLHLTREYTVDPFEVLRVQEVMERDVPTLGAVTSLTELADSLSRGGSLLSGRRGIPLVDEQGRLVGIVTQSDILRALQSQTSPGRTVLDAGTRDPVVAYEDELLRDAVARMIKHQVSRLPVVRRDEPWHLVGYLGPSGLLAARRWRFREDNQRRGWLARRRPASKSR